ncbi:MAG TPA: FCD domain-containing protein [Xanthobacteraceae bacterium]|nr:FCD domain-containing protein [Xanthobacteraceae bacterium]
MVALKAAAPKMAAPKIAALTHPVEREEPGSQIEGAYWRLREDIIAGVLAASEKLRIEFLRQTYGFGASAVREALSRLVSDGLVECEAQRGYWVSPITRAELADLTAARKVIEVEALRQSIELGPLEWEGRVVAATHSLERVETSMTEATPDVIMGWERANRQFHMALISGCPSRWLIRFTELLYDQSQRYRHRTVLRRPIPRRGLSAEHSEIVAATLARDAGRACAALAQHIDNTARAAAAAIFGGGEAAHKPGRASRRKG